ncbi:LacI family DNA-binding transcriptional regulator [Microbacterium hydrocarbonoxydans]|uniref:LacI family DNA-binding transcriptional regulator n=1 Tax=Microbacterium hydrocarbonoxydans TaxID=273678 RepID=UPI0013D9DCE0|nr:LacI family DNA-binding transcriptional regulator [Microbacterium hydrocarbonoxydans]
MTDKRPTLADVARLAGLSPTAVSLILNGRPNTRLSQDARDRAFSAAQALGYRPNLSARALRGDKTHTIGFISDMVTTTRFASGLIEGAIAAAEEAGHVVLVMETNGDPRRQAVAVEAVLDRQADGILFAAMRAREVSLPAVPSGTEVVMLNATSAAHSRSVLPDEEAGGRAAVNLLVEAGHRDGIALIGQRDQVSADLLRSIAVSRRMAGITAAMGEHGLEFADEEAISIWVPDRGYTATQAVLQRGRPVTALLCLNDRIAFGAYQALADAGLSVPGDISVVSFDNDELASYLRPGLTTIGLPHESMGAEAVKMLLGAAGDGELLVPMPPIVRDSIAAPAR